MKFLKFLSSRSRSRSRLQDPLLAIRPSGRMVCWWFDDFWQNPSRKQNNCSTLLRFSQQLWSWLSSSNEIHYNQARGRRDECLKWSKIGTGGRSLRRNTGNRRRDFDIEQREMPPTDSGIKCSRSSCIHRRGGAPVVCRESLNQRSTPVREQARAP